MRRSLAFLCPGWEPCLQSDWALPLHWDSAVPLRAKAGDVTEHALDVGVPKDDVPFYHDLLRQGRSLVIANVDAEDKPQGHGPCSSSRVAKMWTEPARSWEKRHKQASRFNFRPEIRIAFRLAGLRSVVLAAPAENLQTTCWL